MRFLKRNSNGSKVTRVNYGTKSEKETLVTTYKIRDYRHLISKLYIQSILFLYIVVKG